MEYTATQIEGLIATWPGDCMVFVMQGGVPKPIAWSDGLCRYYGLDDKGLLDLLGSEHTLGIVPADVPLVSQAIADSMDSGKPSDFYARIAHSDYGFDWLHVKSHFIGTYEGDPLGVVEYLDTKMERDAILTLFNRGDEICYVVDSSTFELLYVNDYAMGQWGHGSYLGQTCYEYVRGAGEMCPWCTFSKMGDAAQMAEENPEPGGKSWMRVECYRMKVFGHDALIVDAIDVTARRLAEQLQEADARLISTIASTVFESIGVIDVDKRTIEFRNDQAITNGVPPMTELDYDNGHAEFIERMIAPYDREASLRESDLDYVMASLQNAETCSYTYDEFVDGGSAVRRKMIQYWWASEDHTHIISLKSDVDERFKEQEQRRRELEKALDDAKVASTEKADFLARVSHDMRTPLNGILGLSRFMVHETDLKQLHGDARKVILSGEYLLNLVNDTLDVGRLEGGNLSLKPVPTDGTSMIQAIIDLVQPLFDEKGVELKINIGKRGTKPVMADAGRIEQVLVNVLSNAVKFTSAGGVVTFSMTFEDNEPANEVNVTAVVSDTGCGMSEEFLPHIFESFSQESTSSARGIQQGTGLGMVIAKMLCEEMGGGIDVQSTQGVGTTVTCRFISPLCTSEQCASSNLQSKSETTAANLEPLAGHHVLVAEDNAINAEILTRQLSLVGVTCEVARDGLAAVEAFSSGPRRFDAILMDVRMPGMDGLEATRQIRSSGLEWASDIPIVALTANAFPADIEACLASGMNAHLGKPVNPENIYSTLGKLIGK